MSPLKLTFINSLLSNFWVVADTGHPGIAHSALTDSVLVSFNQVKS